MGPRVVCILMRRETSRDLKGPQAAGKGDDGCWRMRVVGWLEVNEQLRSCTAKEEVASVLNAMCDAGMPSPHIQLSSWKKTMASGEKGASKETKLCVAKKSTILTQPATLQTPIQWGYVGTLPAHFPVWQ